MACQSAERSACMYVYAYRSVNQPVYLHSAQGSEGLVIEAGLKSLQMKDMAWL